MKFCFTRSDVAIVAGRSLLFPSDHVILVFRTTD